MLLFLLLFTSTVHAAAEFSGIGYVHDDGTLQVAGRTVHLFGIYLPLGDQTCYTFVRPVMCGPRAVLALRLRVNGFVQCRRVADRPDGSVDAVCETDSAPFAEHQDLAAYLLEQGLAVARPDAPFEYQALEKIARQRGIGVWGGPEVPRR